MTAFIDTSGKKRIGAFILASYPTTESQLPEEKLWLQPTVTWSTKWRCYNSSLKPEPGHLVGEG